MPLSRWIAEFNRDATNRVASRFAGHLPPFALIEHVGRRSGRRYRTPVMIFPTAGGYAIALTYGPNTDWVRNVIAAGGCTAIVRNRRVALREPRLVHGAAALAHFPLLIRTALRLLTVRDALVLTA